MALKQCPECKKEVSERAKRCPHCGFQQPRNAADTVFSAFLILILLAIVGVVIMVVVQTQKTNRVKAELDVAIQSADRYLSAYGYPHSPSPTQVQTSRRNTAPANQETKLVTLTQPLSIGGTALPVGTQLEFVSQNRAEVGIRYAGAEYMIPISATDLK
jgi:hypothetical protein